MMSAAAFAAREAARTELADHFVQQARARATGRSARCRAEHHEECSGTAEHRQLECLCTCHDPATTCWVWWSDTTAAAEIVGTCTGHYDTANEAIRDGFAGRPGEPGGIGERGYFEQVSAERLAQLDDWDLRPATEKAALRPTHENED